MQISPGSLQVSSSGDAFVQADNVVSPRAESSTSSSSGTDNESPVHDPQRSVSLGAPNTHSMVSPVSSPERVASPPPPSQQEEKPQQPTPRAVEEIAPFNPADNEFRSVLNALEAIGIAGASRVGTRSEDLDILFSSAIDDDHPLPTGFVKSSSLNSSLLDMNGAPEASVAQESSTSAPSSPVLPARETQPTQPAPAAQPAATPVIPAFPSFPAFSFIPTNAFSQFMTKPKSSSDPTKPDAAGTPPERLLVEEAAAVTEEPTQEQTEELREEHSGVEEAVEQTQQLPELHRDDVEGAESLLAEIAAASLGEDGGVEATECEPVREDQDVEEAAYQEGDAEEVAAVGTGHEKYPAECQPELEHFEASEAVEAPSATFVGVENEEPSEAEPTEDAESESEPMAEEEVQEQT